MGWQIMKRSRAQPRPYYVARPAEGGGWEQLRDDDGSLASFESEADAQAALNARAACALWIEEVA
jgi:hypothetical protein